VNENAQKTDIKKRIGDFLYNMHRSLFRYGKVPRDAEGQSYAVFNNLFLHIHSVKVRKHSLNATYTFGLGIISAILFFVLVVTGIALMFYYIPSTGEAYNRMLDLRSNVNFGFLLRNLHRWGAEAMLVVVILHMARVFFTGAYKPPREFNWVIGVILLLLTIGLSYTGYLLPWDQLAFWGITIGAAIMAYVPVIGKPMREFVLGGDMVGQEGLIRFYVLHVAILPSLMATFIAIHIWRIRKDGGLSHPDENEKPYEKGEKK
jgi:quinol-cytochrome oxidoreductase complex cytochrome b subunit